MVEPSSRPGLFDARVPTAEEVVVCVAALQRAVEKEGDLRGCPATRRSHLRGSPRILRSSDLSGIYPEDTVGYLSQVGADHVRAFHERVEHHSGARYEGCRAAGA